MKKLLITCLVFAALLFCMLPVHAAEAEILVEVLAAKEEVQVGGTVEYTVLATGSGVTAMEFQLQIPEGVQYVPNSASVPKDLAKNLGVAAVDWTEPTMKFTFFNDIAVTIPEGTELLRFSCVAQKNGSWDVTLSNLFPFDQNFEEFAATVGIQSLQVKTLGQDTPASDDPQISEPQGPSSTLTTGTSDPSEAIPTTGQTDPTDGREPESNQTQPQEQEQQTLPTEPDQPLQDPPGTPWPWILLGGGGVIGAAVAVAAVIFFAKKKRG